MREEVSMARRKRRSFTREFKQEVVELCMRGDRSIGEVARDLDLTESAVRNWVKQHEVDEGRGTEGALSSEEKEELQRLRRENRALREEREILKKATAFFAKEKK
jgi:transposase